MPIPKLPLAAAASLLLLVVGTSSARAQVQSKDQQKCLNTINKDGTLVAKEQGKLSSACLKAAGKGTLVGTAQSCLTDDAKGKVLAKQNKTTSNAAKFCTTAPSFGFTGAVTVNAGAVGGELDLVEDLFGANLDAPVIPCDSSKAGCTCQQKVMTEVQKVVDKMLAEFVKCKKLALKGGATSIANLQNCVTDPFTPSSIRADSKGMIEKAFRSLDKAIQTKCVAKGVPGGAFPGSCGLASPFFINCLRDRLECRACRMLNAIDGMSIDCEIFDDGFPSGSCPL